MNKRFKSEGLQSKSLTSSHQLNNGALHAPTSLTPTTAAASMSMAVLCVSQALPKAKTEEVSRTSRCSHRRRQARTFRTWTRRKRQLRKRTPPDPKAGAPDLARQQRTTARVVAGKIQHNLDSVRFWGGEGGAPEDNAKLLFDTLTPAEKNVCGNNSLWSTSNKKPEKRHGQHGRV